MIGTCGFRCRADQTSASAVIRNRTRCYRPPRQRSVRMVRCTADLDALVISLQACAAPWVRRRLHLIRGGVRLSSGPRVFPAGAASEADWVGRGSGCVARKDRPRTHPAELGCGCDSTPADRVRAKGTRFCLAGRQRRVCQRLVPLSPFHIIVALKHACAYVVCVVA